MRKNSKENFKSLTAPSSSVWHNPRRAWTDVAYALAGASRPASKYARLKYVGEMNHEGYLLKYVYKEIKKFGWKYPHIMFPILLTELAVREATMSDLCRRCNGKGWIPTGYKKIDCFSCEGSGVLKKTDKFRAKYVRIHPVNWSKVWRLRFRQHVLGIFDVLEFEIEEALRKRL